LDGANEAAVDELAESFAHSLDNQRHTAYYATCDDRLVTTTSRAPANRAKIVGDDVVGNSSKILSRRQQALRFGIGAFGCRTNRAAWYVLINDRRHLFARKFVFSMCRCCARIFLMCRNGLACIRRSG
jgi:hypothetical protein